MRIRFDLHQLNIFCTVVELKSFSQAARKLFISQPTVSDHIKNLEESLGTELLDRGQRDIRLTKAGTVLYDHAQKILALSRETESALDEFIKHFRGEIRIGATPYLGEFVLPGKIAEFQQTNPEVKISLEIKKTKEIVQRIESGQLDLGAVGQKAPLHPHFTVHQFFQDRIVLAAPADHPLTRVKRVSLPMLSKARVILREEGSETRKAVEKLFARKARGQRLGDIFKNPMEIGSCSAARELMKKGMGIAFIPEHSIKEEIQSGTLRILNLSGTPIPRNYYLIVNNPWATSSLGRAFVQCLTA